MNKVKLADIKTRCDIEATGLLGSMSNFGPLLQPGMSALASILASIGDLAEAVASEAVVIAKPEPRHQLTLGEFIDLLEAFPDHAASCYYEFAMLPPRAPDSYLEYYDQIALGIGQDYSDDPRVITVLRWCQAAVGKTYQGWKGGDYVMFRDTPLWAAIPGCGGGRAIVGRDTSVDYAFVIKTQVRE